jgi:hypothetical protein
VSIEKLTDKPGFTDRPSLVRQGRTENQNRLANPAPPQRFRFGQIRDAEELRFRAQGTGDFDHSVSVTIGLNYREQAQLRTDTFSCDPRIVKDRRVTDFRPTTISA